MYVYSLYEYAIRKATCRIEHKQLDYTLKKNIIGLKV